MSGGVSKAALFATLPPARTEDLRAEIRAFIESEDRKLVVLDDDPTGTQTVYDVPVLTTWENEALENEFATAGQCFYILTNSRSLESGAAAALNRDIARALKAAARGKRFTVVSRSDSTLRGHFPAETDALNEELGPFDATILIPYFEAGGRYTNNDLHYVAEGDRLIPAAETAFARDPSFGYASSNLRDYIQEKSDGRIRRDEVFSFSIEDLRTASSSRAFAKRILSLPTCATAIVNACAPSDLEFFALASLQAERSGARLLYRTAAQFVSARLGLETQRPWKAPGGLIVVGSHVPKTSDQLSRLWEKTNIRRIELNVREILSDAAAISKASEAAQKWLAAGEHVVVYTSRELITGSDREDSLRISREVSQVLIRLVQSLQARPRFLIAKGGITSSDLAARGLGVKRALVSGQLLPGVPVWELGAESKFPGMPYVVFPGNVGDAESLCEAFGILTKT